MSRANQGPYLGQGQDAYAQYAQTQPSGRYVQYDTTSSNAMTRYENPNEPGYGYSQANFPRQHGTYNPERSAMANYAVTGEQPGEYYDRAQHAPQTATTYQSSPSHTAQQYGYTQGASESAQPRSTFEDNSVVYSSQQPAQSTRANYAPAAGQNAAAAGSRTHLASGQGEKSSAYAGLPASQQQPKKKSKWWLWLLLAIIAICVILAAVLGGVLGSRAAKNDGGGGGGGKSSASGVGLGSPQNNLSPAFPKDVTDAANKAAQSGKGDKLGYTGTDVYSNPVFTSDANTGAPSVSGSVGNCSEDPWKSTGNVNNLRPNHPRLIAPQYQWDCLPSKIHNDAYLTAWNATIFQNASAFADQKPVTYDVDGGLDLSGILDVARIVQQRIKAWAYVYRLTGDKKWSKRAMEELKTAAGNTSQPFGDASTRWDPQHFLDTAEMSAAYAFAFDWMYDAWTNEERANIIDWIVTYGINPGLQLYNTNQAWWSNKDSGNGNWNCVSNGGLIFAALAIQGDAQGADADSVGQILQKALPNVKSNCMRGVYEDGTWSETPNYWYFGTNAQARLLSALETATGNDQGLMDQNKNWYKTGDFHMYVTGNAGMFAYGDNGPNKFATTANQMFLYAQKSNNPRYALFQRDRADAASDPLSMFWYDPATKGAFWNGLALDKFFDNSKGSWASMRSSWTDLTGNYVAIKASNATGHQTHGDLDAGDFVIDALGTRWAGEYGSDNYLSKNYFSKETDDSDRWKYFRKGSQGQNTLVIGNQNQVSSCKPVNKLESSGAKQDGTLDYTPGKNDIAYFITDLSTCYSAAANAVRRGIRFLNGRRQILVQDEIKAQNKPVQWRVQTNATVSLSQDKRTATMKISKVINPNAGTSGTQKLPKEVTMVATILQPQSVTFASNPAYSNDSPNYLYGKNNVPQQDTFDAGVIQKQGSQIPAEIIDDEVTVLSIDLPQNQDTNLQVVWQPQYSSLTDADKATPKNVPLDNWSLTSH